jgi:hypothetical protein
MKCELQETLNFFFFKMSELECQFLQSFFIQNTADALLSVFLFWLDGQVCVSQGLSFLVD